MMLRSFFLFTLFAVLVSHGALAGRPLVKHSKSNSEVRGGLDLQVREKQANFLSYSLEEALANLLDKGPFTRMCRDPLEMRGRHYHNPRIGFAISLRDYYSSNSLAFKPCGQMPTASDGASELQQFDCKLTLKGSPNHSARVKFHYMTPEKVYISQIDNDLPPGSTSLRAGRAILFEGLRYARDHGRTEVELLPLDTKDNRLFRYYQSLGFNCVTYEEYKKQQYLHSDLSPTEADQKRDYVTHETGNPNFENCYYMTGNVDHILNKIVSEGLSGMCR